MHNTVSVITICFNNLPELLETCRSVEMQTHHPKEHIIVDGSSHEEILHWLENTAQPEYRFWVHERDKGISDAFNKGITMVKGGIIHLLNSGDKYYTKDAIKEVLNYFQNDASLMWTHSLYVQHRGELDVVSGAPFEKEKLWKGMRTVAHPTMFVKKEVYERRGLYNLDYKIAMDYDLLVRISAEKFYFINEPLIYFAPGGASNIHFKKGLQEVRRSYEAHLGKDYKLIIWQFRQQVLDTFMRTNLGTLWFRLKNRNKKRRKKETV